MGRRPASRSAGRSIPWSWVVTIIAAAVAFVGVFLFFRTRTGIAMRAVAFDQEAALAQGISVGRVFAIAWGAGAALAVRRRASAPRCPRSASARSPRRARRSPSGPCRRSSSAGSTRSPARSSAGSPIGLAEVFAGAYLAEYTDTLGTGYQLIVPYVVMLIVLLVRPYGLFGTPEIRRV